MSKSSVHFCGRPDGISFAKIVILYGLLVFSPLFVKAQLSGSYSVCSSCTYTSVGAAVSDLTSKGVSGAVTINIAAGTYTEYLSIPAITGASSKNTITFKGAGRTKTTLKGNTGTTVLAIGGAYINFDGLTITNTASSGYTVNMSGANYCSVTNSNILAATTTSVNYCVALTNVTYVTLNNNYIYGGYYGVLYTGTSSSSSTIYGYTTLTNNRIIKYYTYGLYVNNSSGYGASNNVVTNNVFDSSASSNSYGIYSLYESGATYKNNALIAKAYYNALIQYPNTYSSSSPWLFCNNFITNSSYYNLYVYVTAGTNVLVAHNTSYADSSLRPYGTGYFQSTGTSGGLSVESNIFEQLSSAAVSGAGNVVVGGSASGFGTFDGNNVYAAAGNYGYLFLGSYTDFASYQKFMKSKGWEAGAQNVKPVYSNAPTNLHLNQSKPAPFGIYAGIDVDADGDTRCKLFPTSGADESNYGKSAPTVKFTLPSVIYPNSPVTVSQTAKAGEPKKHQWFLNGVKVSDSVVLVTSGFKVGANTLKLVTTSCAGRDSFQLTDTVYAPTAVPSVDFISSSNKISVGESVALQDISTNGPTSWKWEITPDYIYPGGIKTATYAYIYGSPASFNPQVQFNQGGKYKICLTATNSVGSGKTVCKTDYITVYSSVNLGSGVVTHNDAGFLYDDGGPNSPYISNGGTVSTLIDPCADSVYLIFNKFDISCGVAFVKVYEGRDNTGKLLGSCKSGFTGGPSSSTCTSYCIPNTSRPDTFKAKNTMYIEMADNNNPGLAGFTAFWWSKPKVSKITKGSFTTGNAGDSICTNQPLLFTNTTKIDVNDPATFLWDLDGDLNSFECVGTCATAAHSYNKTGTVKITLITVNCAGADTATKTIKVFNPKAPKADFTADNQRPTLSDIVFFSPNIPQCVDNYRWTITKSKGAGTGTATYVNGTTSKSSNPQVLFSDLGKYDVKLYVDNVGATQRDSVTKDTFINVRQPYCVPGVSNLLPDLGIKNVTFNTINSTTSKPGTQDYTSFVNDPSKSTSVERSLSYYLTVKRDSPTYNSMTRTAYIDWNGDGNFDYNEKLGVDSNSTTITWTLKVTIPKTAVPGATVMRVAVNGGSFTNQICGGNQLGEYQDYRVYITPYHTLPVITLKGKSGGDTIYIERGRSYTEEGYSATSALEGNITSKVVLTTQTVGSSSNPDGLIYKYAVTDAGGLSAIPQYRYIKFTVDITPPDLVVGKPDTTIVAVFKKAVLPKVVSVSDLVTKTPGLVIDSSSVNFNKAGLYTVLYIASDAAGNRDTVKRYVKVIDTVAPVLTLNGKAVDTIGINTSYTDPGVTVTDNYYSAAQLDTMVVVTSDLDTSFYGVYTIQYDLTDPSGNKAKSVKRTIVIRDVIAPVIKLKGSAIDSVEVFKTYTDPGYIAYDNFDNPSQLKITRSGSFDANFPTGYTTITGDLYTIKYTAQDRAGNKSSVTRTVKVQDRTAPAIALNGSTIVTVCRWFSYQDAGYTLSDNYDKNTDMKIDTLGTFYDHGGTTLPGLYYIIFQATDRAGNSSKTDARAVEVKHEYDAGCQSGIEQGKGLEKYVSVFPNPGTGIFTLNVNLPETENVSIAVTDILGQVLQQVNNGPVSRQTYTLDLNSRPAGIYLLKLKSETETYTLKIEIAR